jgi:hypothetical protein
MPLPEQLPTLRNSLSALCGVILIASALSACSSSRANEDMLARQAQNTDDNPTRSDVYPDFSKPLSSAMPQLSDEDAAKQAKQLSYLAARKRSGAISEAEYNKRVEELRALAKTTKS